MKFDDVEENEKINLIQEHLVTDYSSLPSHVQSIIAKSKAEYACDVSTESIETT